MFEIPKNNHNIKIVSVKNKQALETLPKNLRGFIDSLNVTTGFLAFTPNGKGQYSNTQKQAFWRLWCNLENLRYESF